MLDADAVINNSTQKWVGPDPEKHIGSTPLSLRARTVHSRAMLRAADGREYS